MILEHFNIQVNNPIAVLMQETTKAFLTTAKAKDKYKVTTVKYYIFMFVVLFESNTVGSNGRRF